MKILVIAQPSLLDGHRTLPGQPERRGEEIGLWLVRRLQPQIPVNYRAILAPMGTIIEGEWVEVMEVVTACFKVLEVDCPRIGSQIKIDYRAGTHSRMKSKTQAIETILGRKLST